MSKKVSYVDLFPTRGVEKMRKKNLALFIGDSLLALICAANGVSCIVRSRPVLAVISFVACAMDVVCAFIMLKYLRNPNGGCRRNDY